MESDEPTPDSRAIFTDVAKVYSSVLAIIVAAAVLAIFVGLIAQMLYAIVALLFFLVPERILERRGEDPADYGLGGRVGPGILWGLGATLLTLPFFVPGYWVWEHYFLDREFEPDMGRYRQWSPDVDGEPEGWGSGPAGVWVWSERDAIFVGVRNNGQPNNKIVVRADQPFKMDKRGTVSLKPLARNAQGESREWEVALTHSKSRGVVTIRGPTSLEVEAHAVTESNPVWPIYSGASSEPVEGNFRDERGLWWLGLWIATQFLLVALPEEIFYRGFIQTRLEQGFAARGTTKSWLGFTPAIFWTSVLFGVGHLVVPVGGAIVASRMSVFFPSLLFGWLRRRTDSVAASTVYHAFSNAMVLAAAVHFS